MGRLASHPAVTGFERDRSIATNALLHTSRAVVVHMGLRGFFQATSTQRVPQYFRRIGWNWRSANLLVALCTYEGGLRQGARTSPRLSNVVNYRLDARLWWGWPKS